MFEGFPLGPWINIILRWLVSAGALYFTALIVPGIRLKNFGTALWATAFIALADYWIRPLLLFLTLPLNILTLGLFTFVVNAAILRLCAAFFKDFEIEGWLSAILGAFALSFIGTAMHYILI